ncbi:transposase [Nocardiopsis sp. Huas11]|uniref:transposase n=1 Tax=Nocardiopsis sp. Huas11 TaxID=2183912 RepID=UPI001F37285D|nr:transposase [Nocardiopsis sp. Huas11]
MLTQVRQTDTAELDAQTAAGFLWVASGNTDIQQQALKDFDQAISHFLGGTHGYPTWRNKHRNEGFRVIGTSRVPATAPDGEPLLNAKGKQVMHRKALVRKLNSKWGQVKVPGCGWVRLRLTRRELPDAKSFRITYRGGQWHVAFALVPDPVPGPGDGSGQRTGHKAPGRVEDVPAKNTSLRGSDCHWVDENSRQNQAEFVCTHCGFSCNADTNASLNVAAGQDASPVPRRVCAGGVIPRPRSSAREPQQRQLALMW